MDIDIRRIHANDGQHILHIDHNSCEFAWEPEDWYMLEDHYNPWLDCIVLMDGTPVAFAVFDFCKDTDSCRLFRYCILNRINPLLKDRVDNKMFDRIEYHCYARDISTIEIDVCQTELLGNSDPYDRSAWLMKHGFKNTRTCKGLEYRYYKSHDVLYFATPVKDNKFT